MAKSRVVNTRFWDDCYIADLDPTEKLLFLYFLTNNSTNISGIYEIPLKKVAIETGIDKEMVEKIVSRFTKDGKIFYVNGWVCLRNFVKNQNQQSPQVKKGIERELELIPSHILEIFIGLGYGIDTLSHLTKPNLTKPNLTQHDDFDSFWSIYPKKTDKKKASLKWQKIKPDDKVKILADIPKRLKTKQWLEGYIPNPTTYLNGERWNDELKITNKVITNSAISNEIKL